MKIDNTHLIIRRNKRIEFCRKTDTIPTVIRMKLILQSEEMIKKLKEIEDYSISARNLAYKYVYEAENRHYDMSPKANIERYLRLLKDVKLKSTDKTVLDKAVSENDEVKVSKIIDDYVKWDIGKHKTLVELSLTKHRDIFLKAEENIKENIEKVRKEIERATKAILEHDDENGVIVSGEEKMVTKDAFTVKSGILLGKTYIKVFPDVKEHNPERYELYASKEYKLFGK